MTVKKQQERIDKLKEKTEDYPKPKGSVNNPELPFTISRVVPAGSRD